MVGAYEGGQAHTRHVAQSLSDRWRQQSSCGTCVQAAPNRVAECYQVVGLAATQVGIDADDRRRVRLCTAEASEAEVEQGLQPGRWMGAGKELGRITVDGWRGALQHRTQIRSENRFVKSGFQHLLARVDQASQA